MANKKQPTPPTFDVRFVGPDLAPEKIPLRAVSSALSAVQDLAAGRDPFETPHVPPEKGISLVDVRSGSAVYRVASHAPAEAITNLKRVAVLLSPEGDSDFESDGIVAALRPIESLSEVCRSIGCQVEVALAGASLLFTVGREDFRRISSQLMLRGDTTVVGTVERVGGATGMRCLMRVPGRRRILYCDVDNRDLVRRLGQHLYEDIAATGSATWINRSWRIYQFKIRDFTQPKLGNPKEAIDKLRKAGLKAWDEISNPEAFIRELRE